MQVDDDIRASLIKSATGSATNAVGFQVSKAVDIAINGLLNALLGETSEDKLTEMNDHHDRLLEIVKKTPITPFSPTRVSPREKIEQDVRDSNDHIRNAIEELKKARDLSKCGVCKGTLNNTIDIVGEATGEILDASEKVLAMQKLKDTGDLPPDVKWDDLNKNQKGLVADVVQQYHPLKQDLIEEEEEETHVKRKKTTRPKTGKSKSGKTRK
jgi:hypothetical protein